MSFVNSQNKPIIDKLANLLLSAVKRQLEKDGRKASGKSLQSLEAKVLSQSNDLALQIIGEDYLIYQDTGRKPGSMPPIDALLKWVQQKGIESDPKKAKGIAFAIAKNMKKIGMHSRGGRLDLSKRNFLGRAADSVFPKIDKAMEDAFEKNLNLVVDKYAKELRTSK